MNQKMRAGFTYLIEVMKDGVVIERDTVHNLLPIEGINHILNVTMHQGTQVPTWYIGLFEGNYTPLSTDTAATFPGFATETQTYNEGTRQAWVEGAAVSGAMDNTGNLAQFTSNALKTVYGGFISSNPVLGATTGTLLSVVRFSSPKTFDVGTVLRVTAGFTMTSV